MKAGEDYTLIKLTPREVIIRISIAISLLICFWLVIGFVLVPWIYGIAELMKRFKIF